MAQALADFPALEPNLIVGSEFNRRRWDVELPSPYSGATDRQSTYLRVITTTEGAIAIAAKTGFYTTLQALVKFQRQTATGTTRFFLQSSGDQKVAFGALPTRGYCVKIQGTGTAPSLNKVVNGVETSIGTSAGINPTTLNQPYNIRFDKTGTTIRFRIWQAGSAEPGTWDVSVTDNSVTTAGVYQVTTAATAFELDMFETTIITANRTLNPLPMPMKFRDARGKWLPAGSVRRGLSDDATSSALPSSMAANTALSYDSSKMRRVLTAPGSGSASATHYIDPSVPTGFATASIQQITTSMRGANFPNFSNGMTWFLGFVSGANKWGIQQANSDQWATLVTPSGNTTMTGIDILNGSLYPVNTSFELHLRGGAGANGQAYALLEDYLVWWVDLGAAVSGTIVPTLTLTSNTATSTAMNYTQFDVWMETQTTAS